MEFASDLEKENYIRSIFSKIAGCYDLINSVMSFNQDRRWRRFAAEKTRVRPGQRVLDSCCGTGRLTCELARMVGSGGRAVGVDFCEAMLAQARKMFKNSKNISFVSGNALALPFPDNSFHAATMGFALRNVADAKKAVYELVRVVVPGGRVVILELNRPSLPVFREAFAVYLNFFVPLIGSLGSGLWEPYRYLPGSYSFLPEPGEIIAFMEKAGTAGIGFQELTGGVVAVYWGVVL